MPQLRHILTQRVVLEIGGFVGGLLVLSIIVALALRPTRQAHMPAGDVVVVAPEKEPETPSDSSTQTYEAKPAGVVEKTVEKKAGEKKKPKTQSDDWSLWSWLTGPSKSAYEAKPGEKPSSGESNKPPDVTSEHFLPHKVNSYAEYYLEMLDIAQPRGSALRYMIKKLEGGEIRKNTNAAGIIAHDDTIIAERVGLNGRVRFSSLKGMKLSSTDDYWKVENGFVWTGFFNEAQISWKPEIRLRAKKGEKWEHIYKEADNAVARFVVEEFGDHTIACETTPRKTVTIREELSVAQQNMIVKTTYLYNVGLLEANTWMVENGMERHKSRTRLIDNSRLRIPGISKFFVD